MEIGLWPWERQQEDFMMEARIPKENEMGGSSTDSICMITSPVDGAHVSGNVTVDYFVWSTVSGGIKTLGFYVDRTLNQSADLSQGLKPFKWKSAHGTHALTIQFTDGAGNTVISPTVSVTG